MMVKTKIISNTMTTKNNWYRELGPVIAQTEYQPDNVYSFKLNPGIHHDSAYNEELDDPPDP